MSTRPFRVGEKRRTERQYDMDAALMGMSDRAVYRMFRMDREHLDELHEDVAPYLRTQHPEKGIASCGHFTTTSQRLLIGLRLIYGAKYQDVVEVMTPTSEGRVYDALWRVVDAIRTAYAGRWDFPVPPPVHDQSCAAFLEREEIIRAYDNMEQRNAATSKNQCWRGQLAALDGCLIRQQSPGLAVDNPKNYYCKRKSMFSLLLMAMADSDRRIIWFDISMAPTSHDSLAFKALPFAVKVLERMPGGYFINGDSAFRPGRNAIMTPGGTDEYNYVQVRPVRYLVKLYII
jgi:hypothetical protein